MEAAESRFAQLLKPIRELAQNWDVDLASQLGDYLHEVSFRCVAVANSQSVWGYVNVQ